MTINDCNDADPHSSTFCLRAFCLRAFCLRAFCLRDFCLRTFCLRFLSAYFLSACYVARAMWQGLSLGIQVCLATRVATATFNDFVKTIRKIS